MGNRIPNIEGGGGAFNFFWLPKGLRAEWYKPLSCLLKSKSFCILLGGGLRGEKIKKCLCLCPLSKALGLERRELRGEDMPLSLWEGG